MKDEENTAISEKHLAILRERKLPVVQVHEAKFVVGRFYPEGSDFLKGHDLSRFGNSAIDIEFRDDDFRYISEISNLYSPSHRFDIEGSFRRCEPLLSALNSQVKSRWAPYVRNTDSLRNLVQTTVSSFRIRRLMSYVPFGSSVKSNPSRPSVANPPAR